MLRADASRALLPALAVALVATAARAQEPINGHAFLPEASWGKLAPGAAGQRYYTDGRWETCWSNQVKLFTGPDAFFFAADGPVQKALVNDEVPGSNPVVRLVKEKSRVRVFGRAERRGNATVFVIESVQPLIDDVARLQQAAGGAGSDPDRLAALAREAATLAEKYRDADLRTLASQLARQELEVRRGRIAEDAFPEWLALADRYRALGDRTTAIALLSHVHGNTKDAAQRGQAQARLGSLGAVQTREGWVTFERYKTDEGFVERKAADGSSRWVKKELAELEDAIAAEQKLRTETVVEARVQVVQHGNNATAGKLERGQTMHEARLAGGAPVSVHHHRAAESKAPGARPALWTQWVFADGRRAYFIGLGDQPSIVISAKAKTEAWPSR